MLQWKTGEVPSRPSRMRNAIRRTCPMQSAWPGRQRHTADDGGARIRKFGHRNSANLYSGKLGAGGRDVREICAMKTLVLETTAPFQGQPELVAYDEGLFEREGLRIEWADREKEVEKKTDINVISPKGLDPFSSHGKLLEQGQADMYNACEWGNYCRVQDTRTGSRQIGRRAIVTYAALAVRPDSLVYTAQQLAGRTVGVPFYFGTHYLALHLLDGFLPRADIKL